MSTPPSLPTAFEQAAKSALQDIEPSTPPAWMDANIQAAAQAQARLYAQQAAAPVTRRWWQTAWLKAALPVAVVATLVTVIWLPHTELTPQGMALPPQAAIKPQTEPSQAEATVAAPSPAASPPAVIAEAIPSSAAAAPIPTRAARKPAAPASQEHTRALAQAPTVAAAAPTPPAAPAMQEVPATVTSIAHDQVASTDTTASPMPTASATLFAQTKNNAANNAAFSRMGSANTAAAKSEAATAPADRFAPVRQLLRNGQHDAAIQRLKQMLKREPELDIPMDLRPLLQTP
jgi:resuscitation-promoting factor RpfA